MQFLKVKRLERIVTNLFVRIVRLARHAGSNGVAVSGAHHHHHHDHHHEHSIGSAVAASMATLANATGDPHPHLMQPHGGSYETDFSDFVYLNSNETVASNSTPVYVANEEQVHSSSHHQTHHQSPHVYNSYGDLLSDDELRLLDGQQAVANGYVGHDQIGHLVPQRYQPGQQYMPTTVTQRQEERMDTSSDSAVSSMSGSERVSSASENVSVLYLIVS